MYDYKEIIDTMEAAIIKHTKDGMLWNAYEIAVFKASYLDATLKVVCAELKRVNACVKPQGRIVK